MLRSSWYAALVKVPPLTGACGPVFPPSCVTKWTGIICAPFHRKSPEDHFEWKWIFILLVNIRTGAVLPPCAKWSIQSLPPDQVSQRNILLVMMLNRVSLCVSRGPDGWPVQGCRRCLFIESIRSDWGALPILCYTDGLKILHLFSRICPMSPLRLSNP